MQTFPYSLSPLPLCSADPHVAAAVLQLIFGPDRSLLHHMQFPDKLLSGGATGKGIT